jgi:hypothetical protein
MGEGEPRQGRKGERMMANTRSEMTRMLETLIQDAASGKKVVLEAKPDRKVVTLEREGRAIDTVILSMKYSGKVDGEPFAIEKSYSFADDDVRYALECLLIANNRLQADYDRLKTAGIPVKEKFFTFENAFFGLAGDASVRTPALRLQNFIHLARAGIPVSADLRPKRQPMVLKQEGAERKASGFVGVFEFHTGKDKTTIEKIYGIASDEDSKKTREEIKAVANRRLERDCKRLKGEGIKIDQCAF